MSGRTSVLLSPAMAPLTLVAIAYVAWLLIGTRSASAMTVDSSPVQLVYLRDCATCHAPNGAGTSRGPTLQGQGAAGVDFMLTTGRMPLATPTDEMRRRPPAYSPQMIAELDAYIAELVPGGPAVPSVDTSTASLSNGGTIYRVQCAACHQAAAEGGALIGQNSPPLLASTPTQVAEAVRIGPGTMPVFGPNALSDRDVVDVAAYVDELGHTEDPGGLPLGHLGPLPEGAVALCAVALLLVGLRFIGSRT